MTLIKIIYNIQQKISYTLLKITILYYENALIKSNQYKQVKIELKLLIITRSEEGIYKYR